MDKPEWQAAANFRTAYLKTADVGVSQTGYVLLRISETEVIAFPPALALKVGEAFREKAKLLEQSPAGKQ